VNRPTIARSLSTLSFFGFLNLCSRNRDLDENDAQGTQQRLEPAGFQNGFLRSKLQQRRKTPRQGRLVSSLIYGKIRNIWIPLSGTHLDSSISFAEHIGRF
jgi:hypothetical protein